MHGSMPPCLVHRVLTASRFSTNERCLDPRDHVTDVHWGGSMSTAGGIKVGTFIIVLLSVISFLRREDEIRVFNHSVSQKTSFKAMAVVSITAALYFLRHL